MVAIFYFFESSKVENNRRTNVTPIRHIVSRDNQCKFNGFLSGLFFVNTDKFQIVFSPPQLSLAFGNIVNAIA